MNLPQDIINIVEEYCYDWSTFQLEESEPWTEVCRWNTSSLVLPYTLLFRSSVPVNSLFISTNHEEESAGTKQD